MIRKEWGHNLDKPLWLYKVSDSNIHVKKRHYNNGEKFKTHRTFRRIQLIIASAKNIIEIVLIYLF
tara:strand:- start:3413 stop:3610 length:198 start_codon:yes stop_codon:yes gene_type:complete